MRLLASSRASKPAHRTVNFARHVTFKSACRFKGDEQSPLEGPEHAVAAAAAAAAAAWDCALLRPAVITSTASMWDPQRCKSGPIVTTATSVAFMANACESRALLEAHLAAAGEVLATYQTAPSNGQVVAGDKPHLSDESQSSHSPLPLLQGFDFAEVVGAARLDEFDLAPPRLLLQPHLVGVPTVPEFAHSPDTKKWLSALQATKLQEGHMTGSRLAVHTTRERTLRHTHGLAMARMLRVLYGQHIEVEPPLYIQVPDEGPAQPLQEVPEPGKFHSSSFCQLHSKLCKQNVLRVVYMDRLLCYRVDGTDCINSQPRHCAQVPDC